MVSTGFNLVRDVGFLVGSSVLDVQRDDKVVLPLEFEGAVRAFLVEHRLKWSGLFFVRDVVWLGSGERVVVLGVCEAGVLSVLGGVGLV